jgi:4-hydroxy-3-polyprenylbenzoate decarboxylase
MSEFKLFLHLKYTQMAYSNLEACLLDLERNGQLLRIKEEVDPHLEMAAIHLRIFEQKGPAILFEKVKAIN